MIKSCVLRDNVIRHANDPAKRYVVNEHLTRAHSPLRRRQASPLLVTGVEASSTTIRKGTEDGSVPAVGVGGDNTSLLSFLTFPSSPSTTTVTTIVAAPTTDTDGSAESVTSRAGENTGSDSTQAPDSGTAVLSGAAQTETELQSPAASTTTIQIQTTILKTVQVTAEVTAEATTTDSATREVEPSTTPVNGQQGQQQQGQQPSATVTVVFVTAAPTFTGPTAGFITLTPSEPASVKWWQPQRFKLYRYLRTLAARQLAFHCLERHLCQTRVVQRVCQF
ncbi:hypothetical protein HRR79_007610 [Exophiala dermatitidis]|nr:hypothetical protein HRR79_007610 [Exophiala dermatitidis]